MTDVTSEYYMKTLPYLVAVVLVSAGFARASSSISFTNTSTPSSTLNTNLYTSLSLGKFDSSLGSLTDVIVTINFVEVGGSFTVTHPTNNSTGIVTLTNAAAWLTVRQSPTNSLGFNQVGRTTNFVGSSITNVSLPYSILSGTTQLFSLASTNYFVGASQNITPAFWNAYQSLGGLGSVIFEVQNRPAAYFTGASGAPRPVDAANFVATANMTVTYNYSPTTTVPEPSSWAVGALLLCGAAYSVRRRRQLAAADVATSA